MPTGGGGGGGGLSSVTTDSTLTGNGTSGTPLAVAAPYNNAAPGALGGTTSNTGQFTNLAVGASVPTLNGTTGDITISGRLATGAIAASGSAGDVTICRGATNTGVITMGGGAGKPAQILTQLDTASNQSIKLLNTVCGNVYTQTRSGLVFANLPAASSSFEGAIASITDSSTATWGATITGGGSNHVLAYCDGTNWTVAAS